MKRLMTAVAAVAASGVAVAEDIVIDDETVTTNQVSFLVGPITRIVVPDNLVLAGENPILQNTSAVLAGESQSCSSTSCRGPLKVFGVDDKAYGVDSFYSQIAVYSLKIWQDSVLVRDFVPARRLSDGVGGLYDLVDHSGAEGGIPQFRGASGFVMPDKATGEPPAEGYERLAWLRANLGQSIDTGITPDANTKVEIVFNSWKRKSNSAVVGNSWNGMAWLFAINGDGYWQFFPDSGARNFNNAADYTDYRVTITSSMVMCEPLSPVSSESLAAAFAFGNGIGNTGVGESATARTVNSSTGVNLTSGKHIALFCGTDKKYSNNGSTIYFYSMKIWDGETLVRDFVPCRELAGEKRAGLYDVADHSDDPGYNPFYVTAGTVAFETPSESTGEVPATGYERLAWIKSNGQQQIDTGVTGGPTISTEFCYNSAEEIQDARILFGATYAGNQYLLAECSTYYKFFGANGQTYYTAATNTDYLVKMSAENGTGTMTVKTLLSDVAMPIRFEPTGRGFSAAPIRSTSTQRGIALYDGTKIVVSDANLDSSWSKIPLMYDAGGFAQTPFDAAKLAALEADATLPKGAKLFYDDSKKTLYCKRNIGLFIVVQ